MLKIKRVVVAGLVFSLIVSLILISTISAIAQESSGKDIVDKSLLFQSRLKQHEANWEIKDSTIKPPEKVVKEGIPIQQSDGDIDSWTPISGYWSGCIGSGCLISFCIESHCVGSICILSGCWSVCANVGCATYQPSACTAPSSCLTQCGYPECPTKSNNK
ncbi:MAG: hypothetical protein DDT22_00592 [candidate division WS2 bacterium]|nr:hypothetical protein [Candidatus Lithacetigena glycinireducens]